MTIKLLTYHNLEFLSLKEAAHAGLSLPMSKYHIVGNHMSRLIFVAVGVHNLEYDTYLSGCSEI